MMRAEHVACVGEMRSSYKILCGEPKMNRLHRGFKGRWVDSTKVDLFAYLFSLGLFNYAFNSLDYIASTDRMICE
jgi:hypothetical protein